MLTPRLVTSKTSADGSGMGWTVGSSDRALCTLHGVGALGLPSE